MIPVFLAIFVSTIFPLEVLLLAVGVLLSIAYYLLGDALPGGQSYGKRALEIAVIDKRTHRPCRPVQSFFRNLFLALLGPIDWVFIFRPNRQRLGDWFANTVVVESARLPFEHAATRRMQRRRG